MIKLIAVLVLVSSCSVRGQRGSFSGVSKEPLCVKVDNYCEANSDCCSRLCLSETHKCIGAGISGITNNSSRPASSDPVVNRFGDENKPCQKSGTDCLLPRDCCSGQCSNDSLKCFDPNLTELPNRFSSNDLSGSQGQTDQQGTVCSKEHQQCSMSRSCCAFLSCEGNVCRDRAVVVEGTETIGYKPNNNILDNRFGEGENSVNQTQVTSAPANTKCVEIGSKCYKESECCKGLRCHGFLHQCVS